MTTATATAQTTTANITRPVRRRSFITRPIVRPTDHLTERRGVKEAQPRRTCPKAKLVVASSTGLAHVSARPSGTPVPISTPDQRISTLGARELILALASLKRVGSCLSDQAI